MQIQEWGRTLMCEGDNHYSGMNTLEQVCQSHCVEILHL
jgi:hypothetical protein